MANSIFDFPTTGVYSGLQLVNQLNSAFASLITNNAGATPPADPVLDQFWYNTTNDTLYVYNGTAWVQTAFGAPFVGVQIISGATTVTPAQFGTMIEAQGQSSYTVALPNPSDYVGVNTAVFSNINASSPVSVSTAAGSIIGTGSSGATASLPYGSWALFESDGYNWLMMSTAGYALLGGSASQAFDVGTATGPNNAVPLSQAQSTFAGVNGNSSEAFAVADATASQDAVNLGQANGLYPTLAGNNTLAGNQTIQGTVAVPANAGEITGGAMPSGATAAWVQAAFSSAYAGLIQNYYVNGAQVYSLDTQGNVVAHNATLNALTAATASITGAITVPDGTTAQNPITINQISGGTLSPSFDNITATTADITGNGTVGGNLTISGATNAQSATFTSLTAGSGAFNTLNSPAISGVFNGSEVTTQELNVSGTITQYAGTGANNETPLAQYGDLFSDAIMSGLQTASGPTLTGELSSGVAYVIGQRVVYPGGDYTVAASSTSYLDLSDTGKLTVSTSSTVTANSLRLWKAVSSATAITAVQQVAPSGAIVNGSAVITQQEMTNGSISPSFGNTTFGGGVFAESFDGGSWINIPTTGPSGIGSGGAGQNAWLGYTFINGQWFADSIAGDLNIRHNTSLRLGIGPVGLESISSQVFKSGNIAFNVPMSKSKIPVGINVAGNVTLTSAQMSNEFIIDFATQSAPFTFTTDTAENLLSLYSAAKVGSAFMMRFINNDKSSTGYAATLAAGSGVTISSAMPNPAIAKGAWADYLFTFTDVTSGSAAVTVFYIGQGTI